MNAAPVESPISATIRRVPGPTLDAAVNRFARLPSPAILESVAGHPARGRYSIFASDAIEILEIPSVGARDPFAILAQGLASLGPAEPTPGPVPFTGGWIGYVGYEAGLSLEGIVPTRPRATALPLVRMGLYDTAAIYDHCADQWYLAAVDWPPDRVPRRPTPAMRLDHLQRVLETSPPPELAPASAPTGELRSDWTRQEYLRRVAAAREYIAAGDVYQVNLTQRFTARTSATPLELYLALRHCNPADYAAFLAWDDAAVISSSPELFLDLRGDHVLTRPIKGTQPRIGDAVMDAIRRRHLAASAKDEAELNMIIDLLRNDLGKVCKFGTVRVESAGDIEDHPTVFHRVAAVSGRMRRECGAVDLLRAAFPGGSVTGAPKIRAMRIIDELEAVQRGVYCGAIGYVGLDGSMAMNIAIRTMILDRGVVHVHAGGAIVADSDPEEEYEESLAKAEGMFRALNAVAEPTAAAGQTATSLQSNVELRMENEE